MKTLSLNMPEREVQKFSPAAETKEARPGWAGLAGKSGKARQTAAKLIRKPNGKSRLGLAGSLMKNLEIYGQRVVKAAPAECGNAGGKSGANGKEVLPIVSERRQVKQLSPALFEWGAGARGAEGETGGLNK